MTDQYDIAVIGAGPGGYIAALKAAAMGARTALVEKGPLGGTCLNVGCIPSKALLASGELAHRIAHAADMGVRVGGAVSVDWPAVQARKDKILTTLRGGIKGLLAARKVKVFHGLGKLDGPGRVVVQTAGETPARHEGGTPATQTATQFTASKIILAVGSQPARIPGWPTDAEMVCTSDEALHWPTLPKRLLIVGGGIIGCEFACMMQACGVAVTIVEMMPRLIPELDGDCAAELLKIFKARGIACHFSAKVEGIAGQPGQVKATLAGGTVIEADRVLVAIGRRPATADLGLDSVGLATDRGFVRVDDRMRTPVDGYYCIGDANGRCLLAHAASAHAATAVDNAMGHERAFTDPVPSCVYTFPEIASVGLTAEQAHARKLPVAVGKFPLGYLGKAMAAGEPEGFAKVIRHRESGELLGVHLMGHNVTEVIASAAALMHHRATVREVAEIVWSHPTISESVKEAAEDSFGQALHLPPRKVLRVVAG